RVTFDFQETVPFVAGYEPKEQYLSGAHEVVRVIEDSGDFISLQHILVVGDEEKFPIKHWRQDWRYEPEDVLVFIGGNAWEVQAVHPQNRPGRWSQTVYQVDDSPRYGAVGQWSHKNGVSEWIPPSAWRPLPRRDMTKRDDYHAMDAINRHALTPTGWVHEQNNAKLILKGRPQVLVHEIGVNSYTLSDDFEYGIADQYWAATQSYWAEIRKIWTALEEADQAFGLTLKGEPGDLYMPLLELAAEVEDRKISVEEAVEKGEEVIATYTTVALPALQERLRPSSP
ncbi:MAG: DUF6607 family protein, partial [Pseudomonadota bacterium]